MPRFVRGDPVRTIKGGNIIMERLVAGMDPMQSRYRWFAEIVSELLDDVRGAPLDG